MSDRLIVPLLIPAAPPAPLPSPVALGDVSWGDAVMLRMHRKFRQSLAPVMRFLADALIRGTRLISLNALSQAVYLFSARGQWLDIWGEMYLMPRNINETDILYRTRIENSLTSLGAWRLSDIRSEIAVVTTILLANITVARPKILATDDWQVLYDGNWVVDGNITAAINQPNHNYPIAPSGAFGYTGILVYINLPYDAIQEAKIVGVMARVISAGKQFEIIWNNYAPAEHGRYGERNWRELAKADTVTHDGHTIVVRGLPVFVQV